MNDPLYIIDVASPFFEKHKQETINWSKIPYYHLEKKGKPNKKVFKKIYRNFIKYLDKVNSMGYNAISIDDFCHIAEFDFYPQYLNKKIRRYKKIFIKLFGFAKEKKMKIFINTDIIFFNKYIKKFTKSKIDKIIILFQVAFEKLFNEFNEIDGIIFRSGESDGVDVEGDFKSKIVIKNPLAANKIIRILLSLFEKYDKQFIFRTWNVGAYKIGDIMWNKFTFNKVFKDIESNNFIISMKYGESDFFRYLKLNPLFFENNCRKIIELQARREYEGFGVYPSFIGWDYKKYYEKIKNLNTFAGIHVWCQTGGWSGFKNFTFLKKTSYWNELNTFVTIKIFKNKFSTIKAIKEFYRKNNYSKFILFLKLSNYVIKNLLYDPYFAKLQIYFNKSRIPPILHIFWDNIAVTDAIIEIYNYFNINKKGSINVASRALKKINLMGVLNNELKLPYSHKFYFDTFRIIALCRHLIYKDKKKDIIKKLKILIKKYKSKYANGYKIKLSIGNRYYSFLLRMILKIIIREKQNTRFIDRILFSFPVSKIILLIYKIFKKKFPNFSDNQAMPIETFFK